LRKPYNLWVDRDANGNAIDWRTRVPQEVAETYFQLGNLYAVNDLYKPAEDAYLKALALEPNYDLVLKNLAVLYEKSGNAQAARQTWLKVRQISPNDPDMLKRLGGYV
jgi:tetratricopeptide (TPR) repeat protein